MGIVNGTTNYMLTKMSQNGWSYEEALQEAQKLRLCRIGSDSRCRWTRCGEKSSNSCKLRFFDECFIR